MKKVFLILLVNVMAGLVGGVALVAAQPIETANITFKRAPVGALTVLYDGALGTLPADQSFLYGAFPTTGPTQVISAGGTILDTTIPPSDSAGYFGTAELTLDRHQGYRVKVTVQVLSETHVSPDRAGFSLIVLGDDVQGIELGFWQDEVWAQHDNATGTLFTHGEGAAFDTTGGVITYTLTVSQDDYTLFVADTPILTGPLRDYSDFSGFPDVYETPNLIFLGDNTTSAWGRIKLDYVGVWLPASDKEFKVYVPMMRKT